MKQLTKYILERSNFLLKKRLLKSDELSIDTLYKICNCEHNTGMIESCSVVNAEFKFEGSKYTTTCLIIYVDDFDLDPDYVISVWNGGSTSLDILRGIRDYINKDKPHKFNLKLKNNDGPLLTYTGNNNTIELKIFPKGSYSDFYVIERK